MIRAKDTKPAYFVEKMDLNDKITSLFALKLDLCLF